MCLLSVALNEHKTVLQTLVFALRQVYNVGRLQAEFGSLKHSAPKMLNRFRFCMYLLFVYLQHFCPLKINLPLLSLSGQLTGNIRTIFELYKVDKGNMLLACCFISSPGLQIFKDDCQCGSIAMRHMPKLAVCDLSAV